MDVSDKKLKKLNVATRYRIKDYSQIKVGEKRVRSPYFMNNVGRHLGGLMRDVGINDQHIDEWSKRWREKEIPYAWHRGKGTPEQLAEAVEEISEKVGLSLKKAGSGVIREFMKLYGLGIDCSGFVYEVLRFGFSKVGMESEFVDSLDWGDEVKNVRRAGTFVFAGKASRVIGPEEVRAMDLVLFKNRLGRYNHVAVLVEDGGLVVAQSGISKCPSGVGVSKFEVKDGKPVFEYKPEIGKDWEEWWEEGRLEFRRLRVLD